MERPSNEATALWLRQRTPDAASWRTLRHDFLGSSDPATAAPTSVRAMAARGELDVLGPVTFQNNGFHLSAGPFEALRELWIWFGPVVATEASRDVLARADGERLAPWLIDRPKGTDATLPQPTRRWLYEATEDMDARSVDTARWTAPGATLSIDNPGLPASVRATRNGQIQARSDQAKRRRGGR